MPGQTFTNPTTGEVIATLSWDMGQRAVDVDAGGTLLTRVTDIETLKLVGMQGQTPRGDHLSIRPVNSASGMQFNVECNGVLLAASHVNFGMQGPILGGPAMALESHKIARRADGLAFDDRGRLLKDGKVLDDHLLGLMASRQRVDDDAISRGRTWIMWLAILQTFGALLLLGVVVLGNQMSDERISDVPDETRIILLLALIFLAVFMVIPLWLSFGLTYRKSNPGTGFRITLVLMWINWLPAPPVGWFLLYFGHKAMARAIEESNLAQGNHERHSTLAEMNHPLAQQR
jgi:hypothetical protein